MSGVSPSTVSGARSRDIEFDVQVKEAIQFAVDRLEQIAWDRAAAHSDQLLMFLLKAHRPEVYNQATKTEHSGPGGGAIPVKAYVGFDPAEWGQHKPGDKTKTVDGDYVIVPESRPQIADSGG